MKYLIAIFTSILLTGFTVNATTTNHIDTNATTTSLGGSYGNSFIFVEEGIEFSVFRDGQFDFYMTNYGPNINVSINTQHLRLSFNSGYDYNAYVQYDEYGAIVQIEHIPVYYDYFGRVSQVGDVCVNYNRFGYVSQVGGLYIHYNRYYRFSHCSGYINANNRYYVARPRHSFYRIPHFNHCVVYNRPYRQHYRPVRHHYTGPYTNNYRRRSAVSSRRGTDINRRSELATRVNNTPRSSESSNTVRPRRGNEIFTPRTTTQSTPRTVSKPSVTTNTSNPRVSTKPRTESKPSVTSSTSRPNRQVTRPSQSQNKENKKPESSRNIKYNKNKKASSKRMASNTRKRR